ncbi:Murein L,D-transpeptidase YcbB/YkuD [Syntrophus gentianae]|uniref:Murein L,D-transpeptidase YcbB/YkuD n=1 Tax=Syntrophus gentianae TaxID=43775 RepID=A0A1H7XZF7_9BACT|nr:L,D-transpeptidase family protein [Syntrophus gentianae]SEM39103.1 Murein L,D-transpeptidase YcbB/YkuD [Syntrophus gentianae]
MIHSTGKTVSVVLLSLMLLVTALGQNGLFAGGSGDEMPIAIQSRLTAAAARKLAITGGETLFSPRELKKFYSRRGFRPAWIGQEGPLPITDSLLSALRKASRHGLQPEDYHLASIEALLSRSKGFFGRKSLSVEESENLELLLTDAFFLYAADLASGKMRGEKRKAHWYLRERVAPDLTEALEEALESGQMQPVLESLAPISPSYIRLRTALLKYREIDRRGGWSVLPADTAGLKKGNRNKRVVLLRKRLQISRDLSYAEDSEGSEDKDLFDDSLEEAVRSFQQRHGLTVDGIVGSGTLESLNVPAARRVRQIEINLERLRWMPDQLGNQLVVINIPEFRLRVLEDEKELMTSRIVVGKHFQNTPVFDSRITHCILNPYWYVPRSIALDEVLPLIRQYPEYFNWEKMKVLAGSKVIPPWEVNWEKVSASNFKYQLRQDPGLKNPLGRIKFVFPNSFDVYLHDTPDRYLFEWAERSFSHGCIRVEKTTELAVTLLHGKPSREALLSTMESGEMKTIRLPRPVEIQVLYFTAWVDDDGSVQFRRDIYKYDEPLQLAMEKAVHRSGTGKN